MVGRLGIWDSGALGGAQASRSQVGSGKGDLGKLTGSCGHAVLSIRWDFAALGRLSPTTRARAANPQSSWGTELPTKRGELLNS